MVSYYECLGAWLLSCLWLFTMLVFSCVILFVFHATCTIPTSKMFFQGADHYRMRKSGCCHSKFPIFSLVTITVECLLFFFIIILTRDRQITISLISFWLIKWRGRQGSIFGVGGGGITTQNSDIYLYLRMPMMYHNTKQ